jgi:mRNA interferase HicA
MKRRELIRYIESHGCRFVREGGNHSLYENPKVHDGKTSVPRHAEIKEGTVRQICKDLKIVVPNKT